MAGQIIGRTQTREVRGTKLVRVREFQCISNPSETYFQFRRDQGQPCYGAPKPCADNISSRIEGVLANENVVDVVYSQDTTAGGRLIDVMTTYYETPDGAISGSVEQPLAEFSVNRTIPLVDAEIAAGGDQIG